MRVLLLIRKPHFEIWLASSEIAIGGRKEKKTREKKAALNLLRLSGRNMEVDYTPEGKPFFNGNSEKISISHTGNLISCAFSTKGEIGVDIERFSPKAKLVGSKFLSSEELKLTRTETDFTLFWSLKESAYKWYGKKSILFKEQIQIQSFDPLNRNALIYLPLSDKKLITGWEVIENHVVTWAQ